VCGENCGKPENHAGIGRADMPDVPEHPGVDVDGILNRIYNKQV